MWASPWRWIQDAEIEKVHSLIQSPHSCLLRCWAYLLHCSLAVMPTSPFLSSSKDIQQPLLVRERERENIYVCVYACLHVCAC